MDETILESGGETPGGGGGQGTDDGQGTGAFDPTLVQDDSLGPSQLDRQIVDEAIKRGLITELQGSMVLETITTESAVEGEEGSSSDAHATLGVMVKRGLISREKADELLDSLSEDFVPGFKLGRELGRGAMGVVYEATQKRLDRKVALKVVNPALSSNAAYVRRFKREALTLAKLNHPNIVQVYDYGEVQGRIYLALEFVEGEDVAELMKRQGALPQEIAVPIARDAALGLSHAHHHGVIHRDIKPANLLMQTTAKDASGRRFPTKVTDLGLAREADPQGAGELTAAGTILGTPAYMAPEQTEGEAADYRSDIYALGATLYHMLTAKVPYHDSSVVNMLVRKRTERLPNPQSVVEEISGALVRVMDRMLARSPGVRYQTYEELIDDLDRVMLGQSPATPPVPFDQSSLDLNGLDDTLLAGGTAPTDRFAAEGGRPTTGRLGTGRPLTGRPLSDRLQAEQLEAAGATPEPDAGEPAAGPPVALIVVLVIVVLIVVAILKGLSGGPAPSPSPGPSVSPSASPSASAAPAAPAAKVEGALKALAELAPKQLLGQQAALAALEQDLAAVPEGERTPLRIKLQALLSKALDEAGEQAQGEARAAWQQGDYPALANRLEKLEIALRLADREPSPELRALRDRSTAAQRDGAGAAERKLWAEVEASWGKGGRDELALLEKLERLRRDYAAFSPVVEQVEQRRTELEQRNPQLVVIPVPEAAVLSVDGKEVGAGRRELRQRAGRHELLLRADGYHDLKLTVELVGRWAETLYLSPLPGRELRGDPDFLTMLSREPGNQKELRAFGRTLFRPSGTLPSQWTYDGAWRPELDFAGLSGQGLPDDYREARRQGLSEFLAWLLERGAAGWSITWKMQPWGGSRKLDGRQVPLEVSADDMAKSAGEARFLAHGGRELVVGFDRGSVYVGLRGREGLELRRVERWEGSPPESYQVDWDARSKLAEVYVGREKGKPRFFFSVKVEGPVEQGLAFAAARTRVLFSNIQLWARVLPK
ncbi:MAG: serine/threonine-protein kinase [Planctomycetota bacterium]